MENRAIQVSAPDVEKAIERGLARLGLTRGEANIEIIDQGSRGIFGIGARDAIVRLGPIVPTVDAGRTEREQMESLRSTDSVLSTYPSPTLAQESKPEESAEPVAEPEQEHEDEYTFSQDQIADIVQQTLAEVLSKMGIECQVVIRADESPEAEPSPLTLDVLGDDLGALIGRQGEVLNALQYITRLIASREVEGWVNVVVDVERYKQCRAKSLGQLAMRIAERVARTKQPVALEPMPPNERRVIHIALQDHPAVTTQSVGRGENRKVTIIPRR